MTTYKKKVLDNIVLQCETRGIPREESESFLAHIYAEIGMRVGEMTDAQLRRLQQTLDGYFLSYLGKKRRDGVVVMDSEPNKQIDSGLNISTAKPVTRKDWRAR